MAQQSAPPLSPDDDPHSELNVLRREVRQLQASVRDAGLQIASQQDELIELRKNLSTAEIEVEEGLVREANLRMQLELQSVKRQKVESTMAAAEALIQSLKEMIQEDDQIGEQRVADTFQPEPAKEYFRSPFAMRKETGNLVDMNAKLDQVLDSISEPPAEEREVENGKEDGVEVEGDVEGVQEGETLPQKTFLRKGDGEHLVNKVEQTQRTSIGDTVNVSTISMDDLDRDPEEIVSSLDSFSLPNRRLSVPNPVRGISTSHTASKSLSNIAVAAVAPNQKHASSLLKSAFKPGLAVAEQATSAIRSAGVDASDALPREVASIAKSEGAPPPVLFPSKISTALSDAHSGEIYSLATSKDCAWTVSGGDDKLIKVYNRNGAPYATISENTRAVTALTVQHDSRNQTSDVVIYAGGSDGCVRTFRRNGRRKTRWNMSTVLPLHTQVVRNIIAIEKPEDGGLSRCLLTCSLDRTVRMYDVEHEKCPFAVNSPSAVLDVDTFGETAGGLIASGHKDGKLRLWSGRDDNGLVGGAKAHNKGVTSVSCLSDGQSLVTLGRDNTIRLSDIRMNVAIVREMERGVHCVSDWHRIATNGRYVACGSGKNGLCIWNVDSGKIVRRVSSQVYEADTDVLDMVARKLRNPGSIALPLWSVSGYFVGAHRVRQVSFWNSSQ